MVGVEVEIHLNGFNAINRSISFFNDTLLTVKKIDKPTHQISLLSSSTIVDLYIELFIPEATTMQKKKPLIPINKDDLL